MDASDKQYFFFVSKGSIFFFAMLVITSVPSLRDWGGASNKYEKIQDNTHNKKIDDIQRGRKVS